MKHLFIVNPAAGKGNKVHDLVEKIHSICKEKLVTYEIYLTQGIGDATRFIREFLFADKDEENVRFYACGGDGTLNEVVNGIYGDKRAEVAIVPIGTGNDFIRNFGEEKVFFDIEHQISAPARECDVIRLNDSYCMNMVNIGFDCEVVGTVSKIKRFPLIPSKLAYIMGVIVEFVHQKGVSFRLKMDGKDYGQKKLLISLFANGSFCGGGFRSAPYADLNDGKMDICFIRFVKRFEFVRLIGSYKKGTHLLRKDSDRYFDYYKCSDVVLDFDREQRICIDGEIDTVKSLHLSTIEKAIRFVVPEEAVFAYEAIQSSRLVQGI